jgi:hypothetical protein
MQPWLADIANRPTVSSSENQIAIDCSKGFITGNRAPSVFDIFRRFPTFHPVLNSHQWCNCSREMTCIDKGTPYCNFICYQKTHKKKHRHFRTKTQIESMTGIGGTKEEPVGSQDPT